MVAAIMTVCSFVVFAPVNDCIPERPPIRSMPILAVQYDPASGGINCDGDCSHLALAPMHQGLYGRVAACPLELIGRDVTAVLSHPAIGERACLDTGGAIVIEYRHVVGVGWLWVVIVDLLERSENGAHPANYSLLWGWSMSWQDTAGVIEGLLQ